MNVEVKVDGRAVFQRDVERFECEETAGGRFAATAEYTPDAFNALPVEAVLDGSVILNGDAIDQKFDQIIGESQVLSFLLGR